MLEIKWLIPHSKYAYSAGNICKMEKEKAEILIKSGHVELFKRPKPLKKQNATKK
jgi:hypothetical protein